MLTGRMMYACIVRGVYGRARPRIPTKTKVIVSQWLCKAVFLRQVLSGPFPDHWTTPSEAKQACHIDNQ